MYKQAVITIALLTILFSCKRADTFVVNSVEENAGIDSIYISEIPDRNGEYLAKISLDHKEKKKTYTIKRPTTARLHTKEGEKEYLTILTPGKELDIVVHKDSAIQTNSLSDSLLNYISNSTLPFLNANLNVFMGKNSNTDTVIRVLNDFRERRDRVINTHSEKLTEMESHILKFQNSARIYNFMFFLGRVSKDMDLENNYFDFLEQIDHNSTQFLEYPGLALHKLEREYFQKEDTLEKIDVFLDYIEQRTENKELSDWYKVTYVMNLIEYPFPWKNHEDKLNASVLREILQREQSNRFYNKLGRISEAYFSAQKGAPAYDFEGEAKNGEKLRLSDLKGNIVFIDVWATWCGPCINQRPNVISMSEQYKNNPEVSILMISVDSSKEKWAEFLAKNQSGAGTDLLIKDGKEGDFGQNYNIQTIPKYILINKNGTIVSSAIEKPSEALDLIEGLVAGK